MNIRIAGMADAAALAQLAERTFRRTYEAANSAANMEQHCSRNFGVAQQRAELENPAMTTLVAEADSTLVAFGQLLAGETPACVQAKRPIEIFRFYVEQAWQGKGLAAELMARLCQAAAAREADSVWLGVFASNSRAIRFYQKCGFRVVGNAIFVLGEDRQQDFVMQYQLPCATP